ncbi:MAG: hypothetical protein GY870_11195 [archaeon]|nr:hypothetical protein [archaeon]
MAELLEYIIGMIIAISGGIFNNIGLLLQKKVINEIPITEREEDFMKKLMKNPTWVSGLLIALIFGSIALIVSQMMIGPALVPGLMASGLIVLAIGSTKILGEKLEKDEILGIVLMVIGILLLGLSQLEISDDIVIERLEFQEVLLSITIFSGIVLILWIGIHYISFKTGNKKGIVMAFSNGFPFCLSNFWISPLIALIGIVFSGTGNINQLIIFIIACVMLIMTNFFGIKQTQEVFKYAPASKAIPIQQLPIQITPILVYFLIFSLTPPYLYSMPYVIIGVVLILISGFLLGKRQAELEAIE